MLMDITRAIIRPRTIATHITVAITCAVDMAMGGEDLENAVNSVNVASAMVAVVSAVNGTF